jgi:hypothetical protein
VISTTDIGHAQALVRRFVPVPHRRELHDLLAQASAVLKGMGTIGGLAMHYALPRARSLARAAYHHSDLADTEQSTLIMAMSLVERVLRGDDPK